MEKYYIATVSLKSIDDNGKQKTVKENYLVSAVSVTDVEVKIVKEFQGETLEYEIVSVRDSKIIKVI